VLIILSYSVTLDLPTNKIHVNAEFLSPLIKGLF